ncbi:MAG: polyribonucleotide nucleotidyltransferase [Epsilonproteobacteria bacterium]|nr:polyribonucleotide nucleotidyltransferase [Campylobacterota bacterium]
MSIVCELELNNQKETFLFDKIAKQSNGSVLYKVGDAVLLAAVVSEFDNPVSEDFTPLTIQYIEKTYAAGKIPGGFVKREGKPSDYETLTSRIIDRSLRPLFPDGYVYPTTITVMVLSVDRELDLQVLALNAASAALFVSDLPIEKSICGVRVGKIDGEIILNPTNSQMENSTLDLYLAGSSSELLMIEMQALSDEEIIESSIETFVKKHNTNDINEDELIDIIKIASEHLVTANKTYEQSFEIAKKEKVNVTLSEKNISDELLNYVKSNYKNETVDAICKLAKKERAVELKDLAKKIVQDDYCITNEISQKDIYEAVSIFKKELVREMILIDKKRADGRGLKDVRPISIETNILPSAHSSCLFTRGETQALVIGTLGNEKDAQMYELLGQKKTLNENFMVHYNFPGFSVGEAKPIFGVGRRELGHGNLAKRSLQSSIDKDFTDTVRLVSEILESNGSSSMATVCGGSLTLKAAGVPVDSLIAGVAMGAIFDENNYAILTDIMGLEDHDGDVDFKVAGTANGITALQMDIKLGGVTLEFLKEALYQAKEGRNHILNIMEEAAKEIVTSDALPLIEQFKIDPSKIFAVIGKAGSVIREIIEKFEVSIDLDKETGNVKITGKEQKNIYDASEYIKNISSNSKSFEKKEKINFDEVYKADEIVKGKVLRLTDFGAFVELKRGGEGLLHISKVSKERVANISDVLSENQEIEVKILKVSKDRIELSNPLI